MKDKVTSFETFVRLPWVSWAAPKAVRSDMAGPTLLGVVAASITGGGGHQAVLKPSGATTLPDGGAGLTVDDATKQAAVGASCAADQRTTRKSTRRAAARGKPQPSARTLP